MKISCGCLKALCPDSWYQMSRESGTELKWNHRRAPLNASTSRSYKISSVPKVRENLQRRRRGAARNHTISCQYFHTDEAFQATSTGETTWFSWGINELHVVTHLHHNRCVPLCAKCSTGYLTTLCQVRQLSSEGMNMNGRTLLWTV